jgi:hypothetical protein
MNYRVSLVFLCVVLPSWCDDYVKTQPETTSTQHFDFAPGGTIRFDGSYGDLFIEGWDQPEVEFTVTKSVRYKYESEESPKAANRLSSLEVVTNRTSPTELVISNKRPAPSREGAVSPPVWSSTKGSVLLEYELHVPRNSRFVIRHGNGQILVRDITGDIDASCSMGEMSLWLSGDKTYSIDARSSAGTILSEFAGSKRSRYMFGQSFTSGGSAAEQKIRLRVGYGNIAIEPILTEPQIPATGR